VYRLDHYLPKESYPGISLQPTDLAPICGARNAIKLARVAAGQSDQFLHCYYEDLGGDGWLRAVVIEDTLAPVVLDVVPMASWSAQLAQRVETP
jgi:hypothetical protein